MPCNPSAESFAGQVTAELQLQNGASLRAVQAQFSFALALRGPRPWRSLPCSLQSTPYLPAAPTVRSTAKYLMTYL
jgi:hypothetical protein